MKEESNKQFWSRFDSVYEKFTTHGTGAEKAYDDMTTAIIAVLNRDMDVLELAAGPGVLSNKIGASCRNLEATDFSEKMIKEAAKKQLPDNVNLSVADATTLTYESGRFDAVVIANALHIMPNPEKALSEIKRVLTKDGLLIAPTFTRENVKSRLLEKLMETVGFKTYSKWTHESFKTYLNEHGFEICSSKVITGHNFPISFVVATIKH